MPGPYANPSGADVSGRAVLRWMIQRSLRRLPRPPQAPVLGVAPDLARITTPGDAPQVTWIGHSTVLLQLDGRNILTDPVFSTFASPLPFAGPRRHQPPGVAIADLPRIDVVAISHEHYDHLDLRSVRQLALQPGGPPLFVVPAGLDRWLAGRVSGLSAEGPARTVVGLEWGEALEGHPAAPRFAFHFERVQHWANRNVFERNVRPWGSWAMLHPDFRFWFAGDLGYSDDPARIGARFGGFDLAAIPIGAYEPRWFMKAQHCDPAEAVQILEDARAREAMAIHWGTFPLTDEPLDQPPKALAAALAARGVPAERFRVFRHGETRAYAARGTSAGDGEAAQIRQS